MHGWTQSGPILRARAAPLHRHLTRIAEVRYPTAPCSLPARADGSAAFGWWLPREDGATGPPHEWPAARAAIAAAAAELGGCDALIGFSQGAVAAHALLSEIEAARRGGGDSAARGGALDEDAAWSAIVASPPRAVVLLCGFPAPWLPPAPPLATPALVVVARGDAVVLPARQAALAGVFAGATVHEMEGGHAPPQRAADVRAVTAFLVATMSEREPTPET